RELRARGGRASVALKPATPIEPLADILNEFDQILIMTVEPGFGGQSFLDIVMPKLRRTRELIDGSGADIWLQSDGGGSVETSGRAAEAGADTFVAGSAVYKAPDPDEMVTRLRQIADEHTSR
ncbi:MAG: ribulose-phosphate 3-epimerase, partial [Acidipropionibacterium acidipropionici]|nr:ribulose-phosphate 3-epimerase [Acidipropionibacterium acidipropionici]